MHHEPSSRLVVVAAFVSLFVLCWRPVTLGQSTAWVRTGGPSGGIGYDIRVRPDNPDIMYVTDALAGVHKSTDGGLTWVSINQGIDARVGPSRDHIPVFCITLDPNNPDVLWVGMHEFRGVYRSGNGGATWEKRTNGIAEEFGLTVRGITVQAGNPNTVYVSTGIFDREAANSRQEFNEPGGVGILKSTDGGASWATINSGLGNLYVGSLFMHPRDPQTLLARTGNISYRDGGGIYLTTDAGGTWQHVGGDLITSVEFSTGDPSLAYATGNREFFRSSDGGQTWRAYLNRDGQAWGPAGIIPGFPIDVQIDPRDTMRLFVNNYGGGNFLTADGGASWDLASTGYTGAAVTDVAVGHQDAAVIYANAKSGPFRSRDGGQTWVGMNPVDLRPVNEGARLAVDPEDDNHILMSSAHQGFAFESVDGGATWQLVIDYQEELMNLPGGGIRFQQGLQAIAFAPSWRLKVYGGFGVQRCVLYLEECSTPTIVGVLTSDDGGKTWTRQTGTGFDTSSVPAIAVHPQNRDVAWAGTLGKGVFKTTDGGSRWTAASTGLGDLNVEALAVDPTRPDVLYAGTGSKGVYKSRDGGATWTASGGGMKATEEIKALAVNPGRPDLVYAGSYESGVYATTNGGASWTLVNNGLRNRSIRAMTISRSGDVLYVGTFGEGVFRLGAVSGSATIR